MKLIKTKLIYIIFNFNNKLLKIYSLVYILFNKEKIYYLSKSNFFFILYFSLWADFLDIL